MSYFINLVKKDQCVLVTCAGEMTLVEMMAARSEANNLLSLNRWSTIVVNIAELRSTLTMLEWIDLASDLSSDLPPSARIALVIRPDQVEHAKLVERVARIEGVRLTYFFDAEEASIWAKWMNFHQCAKPQPADNLLKV